MQGIFAIAKGQNGSILYNFVSSLCTVGLDSEIIINCVCDFTNGEGFDTSHTGLFIQCSIDHFSIPFTVGLGSENNTKSW